MRSVSITEASRDALQGIKSFIPTEEKVSYLRALLKVGFSCIDCVSFVSKKVVPQLQDSKDVLDKVSKEVYKSKLLAVVANLEGAETACEQSALRKLGYPLSLSETFQQRNTRRSIASAIEDIKKIQHICVDSDKSLLVFLSMGFGNPYGDRYNKETLLQITEQLQVLGLSQISVADTVGLASPKQIEQTLSLLLRRFPEIELSVHLHARPESAREKIDSAYQAGCTSFDAAMQGYGGCPMAKDKLIGNIATETLLAYLQSQGETLDMDEKAFEEASQHAKQLFSTYTS